MERGEPSNRWYWDNSTSMHNPPPPPKIPYFTPHTEIFSVEP